MRGGLRLRGDDKGVVGSSAMRKNIVSITTLPKLNHVSIKY